MPLSDQLVAYYNFDEVSGSTLHDRTGNGNDGTWNGTLGNQWSASGLINGCGNFNGTDNYVMVPGSAIDSLTVLSVSFWLKTTKNASVHVNTYDVGGWQSWLTGNIMYSFSSGGGSTQVSSGVVVTDNLWHHVVFAWDGTNITIYVDGVSRAHTAQTVVATSHGFSIGAQLPPADFAQGSIDEIGVWSRALTSAEVTALYNNGSGSAYPWSVAHTESVADTLAESESVGAVLFRAGQDVAYTTGSLSEEWSEGYLTQGWNIGSLAEKWIFGSLQ